MNRQLVDEIEHFFVSYNEAKGKKFKPLGRYGPARARKLIQQGRKRKYRGLMPAGNGVAFVAQIFRQIFFHL